MDGMAATIDGIIRTHGNLASTWDGGLRGWAPRETSELLERNSLRRLLALARTLPSWLDSSMQSDGHLTLAWASLGALLEGSMRFFLCVYEPNYSQDPVAHYGKTLAPDKLNLEFLRQFFSRANVWMSDDAEERDRYVLSVQKRRNAIHAYQGRDIGTFDEFWESVQEYGQLIADLASRLPELP
jgi:hypothetical protein